MNLPNAKRKIRVNSYLLQKRVKRQLNRLTGKQQVQVYKQNNDDYDSHLIDDLPLTINRDPRPGIRDESATI